MHSANSPGTVYEHDPAYDYPASEIGPDSWAARLGMERLRADSCVVDTSHGIYDPREIGYPDKYDQYTATVVAEFALPITMEDEPGTSYLGYAALIKEENADGTVDYALHGLWFDDKGSAYVAPNEPIRFGPRESIILGTAADDPDEQKRDDRLVSAQMLWGAGASFAAEVSQRQLQMHGLPNAVLLNDTSPNGTLTRADCHYENEQVFDYTEQAKVLARQLGKLTTENEFNSDLIIDTTGMNMPAHKDPDRYVVLDAWGKGGEALLVDPSEDPETYKNISDDMMRRIRKMEQRGVEVTVDKALEALFATGKKWLSYHINPDDERAKQYERAEEHFGDNRYMNVAERLRDGEADCDDMATVGRYLAKQLYGAGYLQGTKFYTLSGHPDDKTSIGHTFDVCEKPDGQIVLVDFAVPYMGPLEDTVGKGVSSGYFLPDQMNAYMRRMATR
jgi:hypothetical protein